MSSAFEALGLSLPYSSTMANPHDEKQNSAKESAKVLMEAIRKDIKPRDIVTKKALENAVAVIMATLFSAWGLLLIIGWFMFGHGRRHYWGSYRRSIHAASHWPARRAPGPRPWI